MADLADQWRPLPSALALPRRTAAAAVNWSAGSVAAIDLADLEEGEIGETAVGVALRRGKQAGEQARPHIGHVGGDRIGERQRRVAAAEDLGGLSRNEGPGHRLDQPAGGKRALGAARAGLDRLQHRLADAGQARQRRRRNLVDADDADDLLDEVGLGGHVGAPGGNGGGDEALGAVGDAGEAEMPKDFQDIADRRVDAGKTPDLGDGEVDHPLLSGYVSRDGGAAGLAAAEVEDHAGGEYRGRGA